MVQQLGSNTFGTAKWIVSDTASNGTHTTITDALADAVSGDTIFIRPGTYIENLTLKAGVNLASYEADGISGQVKIVGKCSFSATGAVYISGLMLQTNGDYALEVTGSNVSTIVLDQCYLVNSNNTAINYTTSNASSSIFLYYCLTSTPATNSLYTSSSTGSLNFFWCLLSSASTTASTMSAGSMQMANCYSSEPMSFSGATQIVIFNSTIRTFSTNTTCITTSGTTTGLISNCFIQSGTASAISVGNTLSLTNCTIFSSNADAIVGAGTVSYAGNSFSSTSAITATGQTVLDMGPRIQLGDGVAGTGGCQIMSGTGSPNGAVTAPQGSLYLRTDGTTINNRAYINTDAGTTWTAIVTVA